MTDITSIYHAFSVKLSNQSFDFKAGYFDTSSCVRHSVTKIGLYFQICLDSFRDSISISNGVGIFKPKLLHIKMGNFL